MHRLAPLIALLAGCAAEPALCASPDDHCPTDAPYEGTPCVGVLSCEYAHPDDPSTPIGLRVDCVDERWRETVLCSSCPPRTVERCRTPDVSPIEGTLILAFTDEPVVFGAQGAAMLAHTIAIDGLEDAERCVSVRERTFIDGMPGPATFAVLLRCGGSQRILSLLYDLPCEPGIHRLELEAEVEGIDGIQRIGLDFDGADCPPPTDDDLDE